MASYISQVAQSVSSEADQEKILKVLDHAYVRTTLYFAARSQNKNADEAQINAQAEELYDSFLFLIISFYIFRQHINYFFNFNFFILILIFYSRQGIIDNECQKYFHFAVTCMKGERVDCTPFFTPLLDCAAGRLQDD